MQEKTKIDIAIMILCVAVIVLGYIGLGNTLVDFVCIILAAVCFIVVAVINLWNRLRGIKRPKIKNNAVLNDGTISEIALLNEEDKIIATWDMFEKISLVIGKDIRENHVDVNLNQSPYAAMIDIEHAVLNYAGGSWYIEDLGSKNGVVVQKAVDNRKYRLSSYQPCRLEQGDIIIIGLTRLKLR